MSSTPNDIPATTTPTTSPSSPSTPSATPVCSRIQFGATPSRGTIPRYPSSYTRSSKSQPCSAKPTKTGKQQGATNFDSILDPDQMRSMADVDKEEEARIKGTKTAKAKKMGSKLLSGLIRKFVGGGKGKGV
ncbi:hypothetical protein GMOD_00005566 [Pyrenophora seminiperda CCB06]|uniref:Uncharacterized protein n=1 Tax=Pyrenophora seminiperda CCB06 TaxID=1302712 RepID=A0A3M7M9F0_9PLEO|nr:hypothetical protein GMOD_00005566 [Pyrenophora seminiperda CCB06]